MSESTNGQSAWRLPAYAMGVLIFLTAHALVVWPDASKRSGFEAPLTQTWAAAVLSLVLLLVCVATLTTMAVVARQPEARGAPFPRLELTLYVMAIAPSIYGIVVAMFTGRRLLYLPFAGVALIGIGLAYRLLRTPREAVGTLP